MALRFVCFVCLCFSFVALKGQNTNSQVRTKTAFIQSTGKGRSASIHSLMTHQAGTGQKMDYNRNKIANEHIIAEPQRYTAMIDTSALNNGMLRARKRVIDVNEHENLIAGLTTHQIQGEKEYIMWEMEETHQKLIVELTPQGIKAYIKENNEPLMASLAGIPDSEFEFTKYRITDEGYQYYDGKPIVGKEDIVQRLEEGYKPITMATLYFEIKKIGILDNDTSLTDFSSMTIGEQRAILNQVAIAD